MHEQHPSSLNHHNNHQSNKISPIGFSLIRRRAKGKEKGADGQQPKKDAKMPKPTKQQSIVACIRNLQHSINTLQEWSLLPTRCQHSNPSQRVPNKSLKQ